MKIIITEVSNNGSHLDLCIQVYEDNGTFVAYDFITGVSLASASSDQDVRDILDAAVDAYATTNSYTLSVGSMKV